VSGNTGEERWPKYDWDGLTKRMLNINRGSLTYKKEEGTTVESRGEQLKKGPGRKGQSYCLGGGLRNG